MARGPVGTVPPIQTVSPRGRAVTPRISASASFRLSRLQQSNSICGMQAARALTLSLAGNDASPLGSRRRHSCIPTCLSADGVDVAGPTRYDTLGQLSLPPTRISVRGTQPSQARVIDHSAATRPYPALATAEADCALLTSRVLPRGTTSRTASKCLLRLGCPANNDRRLAGRTAHLTRAGRTAAQGGDSQKRTPRDCSTDSEGQGDHRGAGTRQGEFKFKAGERTR